MDIDLGSLGPVAAGGDSLLGLFGGLVNNINHFVKAAGYFTGEGFQESLANGFMQ